MAAACCYNCGSNQSFGYAEENGYALVRCNGCGLIYVANPPTPDEISQAHMQGRHGGRQEIDTTGRFDARKVAHYLSVLSDLFGDEYCSAKTWLDVGCGHGEFMLAVQRWSNNTILIEGTEPNERKRRSAAAHGLHVEFHDLATHARTYDVISLLNVYSHLPDPPAFLQVVRRLLSPGGELVLETGDSAGLCARDHHRPFFLPDHLSFASEKIVVDILERVGFKIQRIAKYPLVHFEWGPFARELLKATLPWRRSALRYYIQRRRYSQTDMFIRARLRA